MYDISDKAFLKNIHMAIELFSKQIGLIEKAIELRSHRNSLVASNIANRETPGYKAKDSVFEKELMKAYHSDRLGPLRTSDPRHFDGRKRKPVEMVTGQEINNHNPDPGMDGNTVNFDKEMAKLAENQLMYHFLTRRIGSKFQSLKRIISESEK